MGLRHREPSAGSEVRPVKRAFSLAEANRSLVLVRRIVQDVMADHARLLDLQETIEAEENDAACEASETRRMDLIRTAGRLRACLEELDELGVELRDWWTGEVDYPAFAEGRQVFLCWRHGEPQVAHWHELDVDAGHRHPIETLPRGPAYVPAGRRPMRGQNRQAGLNADKRG